MDYSKLFALHLRAAGLPVGQLEYRFHSSRRWRFDLAYPSDKIAFEIEGGVWTGGRHTRSKGFIGDMAKYNAAAELGWRVFRVTTDQVRNGEALQLAERVLLKQNDAERDQEKDQRDA